MVQFLSKKGGAGVPGRTGIVKLEQSIYSDHPTKVHTPTPRLEGQLWATQKTQRHPRATHWRRNPKGYLGRNGSHPVWPVSNTSQIQPSHPKSLSQLGLRACCPYEALTFTQTRGAYFKFRSGAG